MKFLFLINILLLFFSSTLFSTSSAFLFSTGCPIYCACDYTSSNLTIQCTQDFTSTFQLPDTSLYTVLKNTSSLVMKNSFLRSFPTNLCQYSTYLKTLDLSSNLINHDLISFYFDCLTNLEYLNLANNQLVNIDENSFNSLNSLKRLDLSNNQIRSISYKLFYFKLPNLINLSLRNNFLTELDVWMLFLKSILYIDLRYNQITKFVNTIGWNPYYISPYTQIMNADLIDLRFNNITSFDDDDLLLFSICNINEFGYFINLFNRVLLDQNPLNCDCVNSYNMLSFYQYYVTNNVVTSTTSIFLSKCQSPSQYSSLNLFSFVSPNTCSSSSVPFTRLNCGFARTTTTTVVNIPANLINQPVLKLSEESLSGFNDAQISGFVIGLVGIVLLFLILLYCLCPIEILALCFNCIPFFYGVCPCKSGVKRDKEYDLFISYNRANEKWVKERLVPFIKENYLIENYILHYNNENKLDEVYGPYIKDIMSKSSCILFILSDAFLLKEWNNKEFRQHLRYLITKEKTRFICVQMHDICDEEVEEYFTDKLQIPRFVSLENDEFLFWKKLAYFLYTNQSVGPQKFITSNKVRSGIELKSAPKTREELFSSALMKQATPDLYSSSTSFDMPGLPHLIPEANLHRKPNRMSRKQEELRRKFLLDEQDGSDRNLGSNEDYSYEKKNKLDQIKENISKIKSNKRESSKRRILEKDGDDSDDQDRAKGASSLSSHLAKNLSKRNNDSSVILEADYSSRKNNKSLDYHLNETYDVYKNHNIKSSTSESDD